MFFLFPGMNNLTNSKPFHLAEKEKNSFNNDCDFVASYFESVGLISLADKIKRGKV